MIRAFVIAGALSGCATSWLVTQGTGTQRVWDESVREERVPKPGFDEELTVAYQSGSKSFTCNAVQRGTDRVAHSAYRYGRTWKLGTAISVLVEGGLAALFLLDANTTTNASYYLWAGFLALDAAVALPLLLIPKREIYREDEVAVTTPLTTICPPGLALDIAGEPHAISPGGTLGELGIAALDEWVASPTGPGGAVRVTFGDDARDLPIVARTQPGAATTSLQPILVMFRVAGGTLTR